MKKVKSIFASMILTLIVSGSLMAQSTPTVIGVINKADWCSVCQKNGERAMAAFMANNKDGAILFVANDLTNDETKKNSNEELKKHGLDEVMTSHTGTGVVYFFDPDSKKFINEVSASKSDQEIGEILSAVKNAVR